ncbi:GNAT family N-acetyltransferase [Jeotgalibacillus proteolyticus]|uniref:GNAT family N-acetyltransferase n=1 Tax=Jeotgalibacillus proteolyticus TaxID=2082395 RepID=A0A2S5GH53_9BACL|nr:GNAT family N-acetyltransferase [Jeotgalibacillus proteolyticus]PPA72231.1 GNAT family N-acetyltransferase [Jeotgalibacillus proteolyticus]
MRKDFLAYVKNELKPITVRNYTIEDTNKLIHIQQNAFPPPFPEELLWSKEQIAEHVTRFPEGAFCVEVDGAMAGSMTTLLVDLKPGELHTWDEITNSGFIRNHTPEGSTLYVVDLCVDPDFRGLGLGKELMNAAYETVVNLNADRLAGGCRIPGYYKYSHELSPEEYYEKLKKGKLRDSVFSFLIGAGRVPVGLLPGYIEDKESADHAVLMEWKNPFK